MSESPVPHLALLVVDVQPSFLKAMPESEACLRRCALAVGAARLLGIPVFFTEQVPAKLGRTHPALLQAAGEGAVVVAKTAFSALAGDELATALSSQGINNLLICGLEGPVCVYQTAVDALRLEMGVTLLADAITARRLADLETCFSMLRHHGVTILPVETVFYAMVRDAQAPHFKAYTELVKQG
ncbi:MAG: isochorismatase family protein [Verrucomicrobia bacterium]|nr:isochorismatase family protein [Verrucomicrobiota bacterium]